MKQPTEHRCKSARYLDTQLGEVLQACLFPQLLQIVQLHVQLRRPQYIHVLQFVLPDSQLLRCRFCGSQPGGDDVYTQLLRLRIQQLQCTCGGNGSTRPFEWATWRGARDAS